MDAGGPWQDPARPLVGQAFKRHNSGQASTVSKHSRRFSAIPGRQQKVSQPLNSAI
jgi:hypothetical protein